MELEQHAALTARFVGWAARSESVVGVVGVGSTSGARPADRWSDHDLLIVTRDADEAARLRRVPSRLPLPDRSLLVFTEPDHGLTVIVDDGHLLELAICGMEELGWFAADRHRVLFDRGGVALALEQAVHRRELAAPTVDDRIEARYRHLVKELVIVIGRLGRGERISAHRHLQTVVDDLLVLLQHAGRIGADARSDPYDPARRLEWTDPELAARLEVALTAPLELALGHLLELVRAFVVPEIGGDAPVLQDLLERRALEASAGAASTRG